MRNMKKRPLWLRVTLWTAKAVAVLLIAAVTGIASLELLLLLAMGSGVPGGTMQASSANAAIMDRYDMQLNNMISNALDGVLSIEKVYWLRDEDLVAPEPNPECYGSTNDPSTLGWLLEAAEDILDGQDLVFHTDIQLHRGTEVTYYLDDTILALTWKQNYEGAVYTISEVKIAHPSQFRRFLAGGEFGSDKLYVTTEMAASVNAVVASSGDFYNFRKVGVIVYNGMAQRVNAKRIDTCMIDEAGDMILVPAGTILDVETAQAFADENRIRFSVAFGPILVMDGVRCEPENYPLGEINGGYARAALCQKDELHYLLLNANGENGGFWNLPDIHTFTDFVQTLNCKQAYTLDGGQTAVIVMNDEMKNLVQFGAQRRISDIIYFATAIPDGGK